MLDCTSIPAQLAESELFGHEKGAFTGALSRKLGRFELADGGTLFLDEIGELPLARISHQYVDTWAKGIDETSEMKTA